MILKFNKRVRCRTIGEKSRIINPLWYDNNHIMSILDCGTNIESLRDSSKYTATIKLESYFIKPLSSLPRDKIIFMARNPYFRIRGMAILGMKELYGETLDKIIN